MIEFAESTIMVGHFDTLLPAIIKQLDQKLPVKIGDWTINITHLDLIDIYRTMHQTECTLFSNTFTQIGHMLIHKTTQTINLKGLKS